MLSVSYEVARHSIPPAFLDALVASGKLINSFQEMLTWSLVRGVRIAQKQCEKKRRRVFCFYKRWIHTFPHTFTTHLYYCQSYFNLFVKYWLRVFCKKLAKITCPNSTLLLLWHAIFQDNKYIWIINDHTVRLITLRKNKTAAQNYPVTVAWWGFRYLSTFHLFRRRNISIRE